MQPASSGLLAQLQAGLVNRAAASAGWPQAAQDAAAKQRTVSDVERLLLERQLFSGQGDKVLPQHQCYRTCCKIWQ